MDVFTRLTAMQAITPLPRLCGIVYEAYHESRRFYEYYRGYGLRVIVYCGRSGTLRW